jgi:Tfp pilus assembly protein PilF
MLDPLSSGVNVLKGANQMSKDLGGIVGDQQATMENAVKDQHKQRMQAAARKAYEQSLEEFRAFEAYEKQKAHEKEVQKIKAQAISKYGHQAWNEIESLKLKLRKEKEEEEKLMDADRHKVQELFWWCMTVSALITYFFKLYK